MSNLGAIEGTVLLNVFYTATREKHRKPRRGDREIHTGDIYQDDQVLPTLE
jgi:hypothetical protein